MGGQEFDSFTPFRSPKSMLNNKKSVAPSTNNIKLEFRKDLFIFLTADDPF